MRRVVILHESEYSRNGAALLAPLQWCARRLAREYGITLTFTTAPDASTLASDVLCVSGKRFRTSWAGDGGASILAWLRNARSRAGRLLWFDTSDGTGTTQFAVLPLVDRYVKNQVLRDRRAYQRAPYGLRVFTDYIHRRFGVVDVDPGAPHLALHPPDDALGKIVAGWHYGFLHYGAWGDHLTALRHRFPAFPWWFPLRWSAPLSNRPIPLSCRMGLRYSRATVAYPRLEIRRRLAARGMPLDRLPRQQYFRELRQSRAGISPFGYGEVCYRDFECTIAGAAMVKQDMSHLETWPDLWVPWETYIPFSWDLGDFDAVIDRVVSDARGVAAIAFAAQERYRHALCTRAGQEEFCRRFVDIITCPAPSATSRTARPAAVRSRA